jgi:hypothetical protein
MILSLDEIQEFRVYFVLRLFEKMPRKERVSQKSSSSSSSVLNSDDGTDGTVIDVLALSDDGRSLIKEQRCVVSTKKEMEK